MRHAEKIPSAIERYKAETLRVLEVLESVLSKQEWLVGNKLTIADLSFVMSVHSNFFITLLISGYQMESSCLRLIAQR